MTTKISTELLIIILNNVQSTRDLYSSLLVNRIWCKVAIPILWELPFGQECYADDKKLEGKALCIRTYISCLDTQARTLLIQNGFDLSSSPPQVTFDYPFFTHKLMINNLVYFISTYSSKINPRQIIGPEYDFNNRAEEKINSRTLFSEICKLIINRCKFVDSFKLTEVPIKFFEDFTNYCDLIDSILKLSSAPQVFKKLESFTSTVGDYESICELYDSLKLICDNILNMDLKLNSYSQAQLLAKLISVQTRLENLSIADNIVRGLFDSIFWAIVSQKETLKSLRLKSVSFYYFKGKSLLIGQFISLRELYMEDCYGLQESDCLFLASSFPQLSIFHFRHKYKVSQEFIIKILETANTNLKNICLDLYPTITFETFSSILNYCTKIVKLTLRNLSPEQVIGIFNNNFDELKRFSFDCGEEFDDANELLCQIAENVSESLETIEIRMGIFSADSLRKLFKGWCYKGGGGNRKIIVKRTEQARLFTLTDEYFKVIEEYGVQFDIED